MRLFSCFLLGLFLIFNGQMCANDSQHPEEMLILEADHADYQGKTIALKGDVVVEHELGTIKAQKMTLKALPEAKKTCFGLLEMEDKVNILFQGGGNLDCGKALIDYRTFTGTFTGCKEDDLVVYTENCHDKNKGSIPVIVRSRQMHVLLTKDQVKAKGSSKKTIDAITADEDVSVEYNHELTVTSDRAVYQRVQEQPLEKASLSLPGVIVMNANQGGSCLITNQGGDRIRGSEIGIDTVKRQLTISLPRGSFKDSGEGMEGIEFSADKLLWDEAEGRLTLRNHVKIDQHGMGKLQTTKEVRLFQYVVDGHKRLRAIEAEGDTILTYTEMEKNLSHILTCYGPLSIDHQKMRSRLHSPKNDNGSVFEDQQIFFQDSKGEIYANDVMVKYDYIDCKVVPIKIILAGNVRIFNHLEMANEGPKVVLQYALADQVEFFPQSKEMLFKAAKGKRVLFFDKTNSIEVSAPALKIVRDQMTKKEQIQGIGDVRFNFVEHEFEQLRQKFALDKLGSENESAASSSAAKL